MALSTSLVSYYKLDDTSDSVGSNTLTNNNSVTFVAGKLGNGANMVAASSQYLTAADSASLSITGDMTLSGWFNFATSTGTQQLITKRTSTGNQRSYNFFYSAGALGADIFSDGSTGAQKTVSWTPTTGVWYYLSFTYSTSGTGIFYVNGIQQGATQTGMQTSVYDSTSLFALGCIFSPATEFFNGIMDEVGIWSRALSDDEVSQIFNSGRGNAYPLTDTPSLYGGVAYYKLDESSGNASDSINNNTLTNVNTVTYASGKINNGADFGTANTNKKLQSSDNVTTSTNMSISCWVKLRTEIAAGTYGLIEHAENTTRFVTHIVTYEYNGGTRQLTIDYHRNNTTDIAGSYTVTLGTSDWYHLLYTYDGTNSKLYVNSTLQITVAASGTGSTGANAIAVGSSQRFASFASTFQDEVSVFSRALSSTEVTALYASGNGNQYPWTGSSTTGASFLLNFI